jgi:hypothetical protein
LKNKLNFRRKQKIGRTTYVVDVPVVEKHNEAMGCVIRTGGQRDFARDDPKERAMRNIDKNNRKLKKLIKKLGLKSGMGFAETQEVRYGSEIKSPGHKGDG